MAVSIDWGTKIIFIPKSDLTLIQSVPTEIREMNLNWFRLQLKDLEDSEAGMAFTDTHSHNTEVSLGGLTYARVIEILDPYTITFEDGQYAVNLVGANSNVGDKVNVNQVSVRSNNSAGMISSPEIQFASFDGGITIDPINGTDSSIYPFGTSASPCKTMTNVIEISSYRGLKKLYVLGNITISDILLSQLTGFEFVGNGHRACTITIDDVQCNHCRFYDCNLEGVFGNGSFVEVHDCVLNNMSNITMDAHDCFLSGTILLNDTSATNFYSCVDGIPGSGAPILQLDSCANLGIWEYSGGLKLTNITTVGTNISVNFSSGRLLVDSTDTQGSIILRGVGSLSGTTGGTTINADGLIDRERIALAVWSEDTAHHTTADTAGAFMLILKKITSNKVTKAGDTITIYEDNGTDIWKQYSLASGGRVEV
jgi:hypothetical protein